MEVNRMPVSSRPTRSAPALLQKLTLLTRRLLGPVPLESVLVGVTDGVLDLVPADHATIRIFDDSGEELLSSARSGTENGGASPAPPPAVLLDWVTTHGLPLSVPDIEADERFRAAPRNGSPHRAFVVTPLWGRYGVIGVLCVGARLASSFEREDVLLLTLVGNFAAQVLEQPRMERLAVVDEMTLAYTTRYLLPRLQEEMARAWRDGGTLCLFAMRLDRYDDIRRNQGTHVADHVLQAFVQRLRASIRPMDVLVRQGEDRFALILGGVPEDRVEAVADRLRKVTAAQAFPLPARDGHGGGVETTLSVGAASWDGMEPPASLEQRARALLGQALAAGGARVATARVATVVAS